MQLLLEAEVRQLTLGALQQFNLDVEECERKIQTHFPFPIISLFFCFTRSYVRTRARAVLSEPAGAVQEDIWQYLQDTSSPANSQRSKLCFFAPFSPKCCIDAFQIIPAFGVFLSILKIRAVRVGKPWGELTEISPLTMAVSENNNWLVFLRSSGPLPTSAVCLPYLLQGVFPQSLPFLQSHCYGKETPWKQTG